MESEKKAAKHIDISIQVKQIVARSRPQYDVYVATYTAGKRGQVYQPIEEGTDEEFWSIRALSPPPPPHQRLKDPDVIVTCQDQVKFVVEVKWGALPGIDDTDLDLKADEWRKMRDLLIGSNLCRVRGPAVRNRRRYRSREFRVQSDYYTNHETKSVLVTDLRGVRRQLPELYAQLLNTWQNVTGKIYLVDIKAPIDGIPSFREILER